MVSFSYDIILTLINYGLMKIPIWTVKGFQTFIDMFVSLVIRDGRMLFDYLSEKHNVSIELVKALLTPFPSDYIEMFFSTLEFKVGFTMWFLSRCHYNFIQITAYQNIHKHWPSANDLACNYVKLFFKYCFISVLCFILNYTTLLVIIWCIIITTNDACTLIIQPLAVSISLFKFCEKLKEESLFALKS